MTRPCLRLGDEVSVNTYWPLPSCEREWRGRVKAFQTFPSESVLVEAIDATSEMWLRFGALTHRERDE